ncbi:MAG: VIT1/CCC1 transporter family protein [Nanoarchaeota archaeon]|nr:VIT1/CCC1 transporter family protein [Nanoarchaeota archaeon]
MKKYLKDIILGGQDGLVNVLGIVFVMVAATHEPRIILISGLAATFAESISMAGVGYTSTKTLKDYYCSKWNEEKKESEENLQEAKKEIEEIYSRKGFQGTLLNKIVNKISSNKKVLIETMMREELNLSTEGFEHPVKNAFIIGIAAIFGSLIPVVPFFFNISVNLGVLIAIILSSLVLFATGALKAKMTVGKWWRSGIELTLVGMGAAILGYLVGLLLGLI